MFDGKLMNDDKDLKGYKRLQAALMAAATPYIASSLESNRAEIREVIKNTLWDLDGPRQLDPFTRRDEVLISTMALELFEINESYLSMLDIEVYIRRFPYRDLGISPVRYLKYHIESYLNEVYIFSKRVEAYLDMINKKFGKTTFSQQVEESAKRIKQSLKSILLEIIAVRGSHVHQKRFADRGLDRLAFLENLQKQTAILDGDQAKAFSYLFESSYKEDRAKWAKQIAENNVAVEHLLDFVSDLLYAVLFDSSGNLKLPSEYLRT